jgi:hypothetical protein
MNPAIRRAAKPACAEIAHSKEQDGNSLPDAPR